MARKKISLKECYTILEISQNSSMEDVKHAYRKRAFELHPDLNPNNSSSNQDFQSLNEAYVTIIDNLDIQEKKIGTKASFFHAKANADKAEKETEKQKRWEEEVKSKEKQEKREQERKERQRLEKEADERRRVQERTERERVARNRLREQIAKEDARREADKDATHKARLLKQMEAEAEKNRNISTQKTQENTRAYSNHGKPILDQEKYHGSSKSSDTYNASTQTSSESPGEQSSQSVFAHDAEMREQILKELLEDNYARKVYEDIYNELHARKNEQKSFTQQQGNDNLKEDNSNTVTSKSMKAESVQTETKKTSVQSIMTTGLTGQIATGLKQGISGWLKNQIDDELELFFPASKLVAGARMRLQIRSGWSGDLQTVEVTLPSDFAPGKAFRLKGLGKKIGKWQGNLYLTLQVK